MARMDTLSFDENCRRCERLAGFLDGVRADYPAYHARPVAPVGADAPGLLIVGLAPGFHNTNTTGRPFTGDYAGILLYQTLNDFGISNRPVSTHRGDGLELRHCRITKALKCQPPENKPLGEEVRRCNPISRKSCGVCRRGPAFLCWAGSPTAQYCAHSASSPRNIPSATAVNTPCPTAAG